MLIELYDIQTDPNEIINRFQDPDLESIRHLIQSHLGPLSDRLDEEKYNAWQEIRAKKRHPRAWESKEDSRGASI